MKKLIALLLAGVVSAPFAFSAVTAYSPPVGGMTINATAGQTISVALPLLHASVGSGAIVGKISAVGSNYIDVVGANWTAGGFSAVANPYYLRITSGASAGRVMPISTTANTATRLNVVNDGVDLTASGGPVAGDGYEIVLADTLFSMFGANTLQGGPDMASSDNVQIWGGASWQIFYYNTTRNRWERNGFPNINANNVLVRPDRGFIITRRASTTLTMHVSGRVPTLAPVYFHSRAGSTFLSSGVPVTQTLAQLGLNTRAAGWVSGTSIATSDTIQVWGGASWQIFFYHSGNNRWQRDGFPNINANSVNLSGRPFVVRRLNPASATDSLLTMSLPYTIN